MPRCDESLQSVPCAIHLHSSQYDVLDIMVFVIMYVGGIGLPCTTDGLVFHFSGCYHVQGSMSGTFGPGCTATKYLLTQLNCVVLCCIVLCVVDTVTFQFCIQWAQRSAIFSDVSNF